MITVTYDIAFDRVIDHEKGFQKDPQDRGNWTSGVIYKGVLKGTKYGISAAQYPDLDIVNLTLDQAKAIYKKDFWDAVHGDTLSAVLVYQLFDAAVNHGSGNTIKMLQRAIGAKVDGAFGSKSKAALSKVSEYDSVTLFLAERLDFMVSISTWKRYGGGWAARIAQNLRYAAKDTIE